jgi:hypothetical protein
MVTRKEGIKVVGLAPVVNLHDRLEHSAHLCNNITLSTLLSYNL